MILNFKLKKYKCNYRIGNVDIEGICFSDGCGTGKYGYNKKYTRITYIWPKKQDELNYCFLNNTTIISYLNDISKELGFKLISLSETSTKYKLQIEVIANRRYFIYVSTYIRYLYEFPFSLFLYCALKNKENFPELTITHIMQFYITVFFNDRRCHCPGQTFYTYSNINSKCQFNLIRDDFNDTTTFVEISSNYVGMHSVLRQINEKNLPEISNGINNIVNNYYAKYKKSICRW